MFHRCKTEQEIKTLFRRVSKRLHPDLGGEHELMIILQESYEEALRSRQNASEPSFDDLTREYAKSSPKQHKKESKPKKPQWEPFNGIYEKMTENVYAQDPRAQIIIDILLYAADHPSFKADFVISVSHFMEDAGFMTSLQYNSLVKIYYAFEMKEWMDRDKS